MKMITRWAVRTVGLWALAKVLELANRKLRQRQQERRRRSQSVLSGL